MTKEDHWEQIYSTKLIKQLGWYEPHLQTSLNWIKEFNLSVNAPIIDIGGGASTLVDDLLDEGYQAITVFDISKKALSLTKARIGKKAELVTWLNGDIVSANFPACYYELWHDRAAFHFLTLPEQQQKYRDNLIKALKPSGHLILGLFALEAPPKCSGLLVKRYSIEQLEATLGREFELNQHHKELHITPNGIEQMYLYCHFRKIV